jgi:hypothetical protein
VLVLLVSFLLVIVATIFLLSGLFLTDSLALIFVSIACSAVAGIVLVAAVMKSKPRPAPVAAAEGDEGQPAVAVDAADPAAAKRPAAKKAPSRAATNLPIEDYDNLNVAQIQARLVGLSVAELRKVRDYEKRHKNRAGVLTRIEGALKAR